MNHHAPDTADLYATRRPRASILLCACLALSTAGLLGVRLAVGDVGSVPQLRTGTPGTPGNRTSAAADAATAPDARLLADAIALIESHEGRRTRVYRDTLGNPTVGVGFNLRRPGAVEDLARLLPDVSYHALLHGQARLTHAQIDALLHHDAHRALATARRQVRNFEMLPPDVQLVLIDMAFTLGSLHGWRELRQAVEAQRFGVAAGAMRASRWRHQVGGRATRLIAMMQAAEQHATRP